MAITEPLDPNSDRGKQLAEELSELLARIADNIAARQAIAAIESER